MKKIVLFIDVMLLSLLTGCVYIGLLSSEVKKYIPIITEQIVDFSFLNYECNFYYFPDQEKEIRIQSTDGKLEMLITTTDSYCYNDGSVEYTFDKNSKTESLKNKEVITYSSYQDVLDIIAFIQGFDGTADKSTGRRGVDNDDEGILDEVTFYYYHMDWKYSKGADLNFYISKKTNKIKRILLLDRSNDEGKGTPHFMFTSQLDENQFMLKEEYDYLVQQEKEKTANL